MKFWIDFDNTYRNSTSDMIVFLMIGRVWHLRKIKCHTLLFKTIGLIVVLIIDIKSMFKTDDIFANRYKLLRLIGRGGFAEVWLAQDVKTNLEVALKIYAPGTGLDEHGVKLFMSEFALTYNLNHSNLLRATHFDEVERMPYLVLPFCSKGSCTRQIGNISEDELWRLLHDVAAGLKYLHSKEPPIIHQDIKPDNILCNDEGVYLISDFGISTKIRSTLRRSAPKAQSSGGTLCYMAPERFSADNTPIKASDIWSVGAMLYELMTGEAPFGEHGGLIQKSGAEIPLIRTDYSEELKTIVVKCLSPDPWDRPTAEALEELSWSHLNNNSEQNISDENKTITEQNDANDEKNTNQITKKTPWRLIISLLAIFIFLFIVFIMWFNSEKRREIEEERIEVTNLMNAQFAIQKEQLLKDNFFSNPQSFIVNGITFTMIPVEGGTFKMGSYKYTDMGPVQNVTLSSYYIGGCEVSQALWQVVMEDNPSYYKGINLPVIGVSWNDCQKFLAKLNKLSGQKFRLLSEAEWEYAARGGSKSKNYTYSGGEDAKEVAWYIENSDDKIKILATKSPNELGIYDMAGNVWEWVNDYYDEYSLNDKTNPQGPNSGEKRVLRGGSKHSDLHNLRIINRISHKPEDRFNDAGLRLALDLTYP